MLVSADELIRYMSNANMTADQRADIDATLAGVQQELETYLNRPLELVQVREAVRTDAIGNAYVSVTPIHKVISVNIVEVSYGPSPLNQFSPYIPPVQERDPLIGNDGTMIDLLTVPNFGDPLTIPGGVHIGFPDAWYAVEYLAGYNGFAIEGLKQDIKRVAAREVAENHIDGLSLRDGNAERAAETDNRVKGWTPEEKAKWDRFRRRVIA